jgi:hypothetical protein
MILKVYASKAVKGIFYLEGKPTWDPIKQEIWLDSLDYILIRNKYYCETASSCSTAPSQAN